MFLGRPILWGLATAGEDGVTELLSLLREELDNIMANAGNIKILSKIRCKNAHFVHRQMLSNINNVIENIIKASGYIRKT